MPSCRQQNSLSKAGIFEGIVFNETRLFNNPGFSMNL